MNKKKLIIVAGVALIVLLLAGLGGAAFVFAQRSPRLPFPSAGTVVAMAGAASLGLAAARGRCSTRRLRPWG